VWCSAGVVFLNSLFATVVRLTEDQYLPSSGNVVAPSLAWSTTLNLALWLKVQCETVQTVSLFVEYEDSRGQQRLLVDSQLVDSESELLFSNLVKIPIKGSVSHVSLVLSYLTAEFSFELEELFIRVIEPTTPDPRLKRAG
jgi:hypothetical protein